MVLFGRLSFEMGIWKKLLKTDLNLNRLVNRSVGSCGR